MHYLKQLPLLMLVLVLAACGQPVPAEKSAYVGEWNAPNMQLLITQDGSVRYERIEGGVTTSVSGPLQKFEGDNFSVGIAFMSTTFVVSKAPYEEAGAWKMIVDDVELVKIQ